MQSTLKKNGNPHIPLIRRLGFGWLKIGVVEIETFDWITWLNYFKICLQKADIISSWFGTYWCTCRVLFCLCIFTSGLEVWWRCWFMPWVSSRGSWSFAESTRMFIIQWRSCFTCLDWHCRKSVDVSKSCCIRVSKTCSTSAFKVFVYVIRCRISYSWSRGI